MTLFGRPDSGYHAWGGVGRTHHATFRSPDGLLLEITTGGPGFAVDEDEGSLGSSLRLPPWIESERSRIPRIPVPLES